MCKVMGIVNVTPDSFSDGGKFNTPEEAIRRAKNLIEEGAAIIDIGGESTRPGATPLKWDEEWARVEPVLRGLSPQLKGSVPISIDTYHPETAERAIALGASIVNCVFKEPIRDMAAICAKNNAELVIPCRISDFTKGTVPIFAGTVPLDMGRLYLDPMIGFGTTREEDLEILNSIKPGIGRFLAEELLFGKRNGNIAGTQDAELSAFAAFFKNQLHAFSPPFCSSLARQMTSSI